MRVLIATDGSDHSQAALSGATRILLPEGRDVDLVCVAPEARDGLPKQYERLSRRARKILDVARQRLARDGICARTLLRHGSPTRVLTKIAEDYDIVVLGAAGRQERTQAGLGPVVSRVVEHGRGTVLVCRSGRSEGALRVLVPIDGSDGGFAALHRLIEIVNLSGAEVTLLHVVETPWFEAAEVDEPVDLIEEADHGPEHEFVSEGERVLETARDRLPGRTSVSTLIYEGLPADEILGEADRGDYDLVVLGANRDGGLKQQMLGSVSSKVAWNAGCSVLLVR